jgi:hypothetical protein
MVAAGYGETVKDADQAFAIVRLDRYISDEASQATVKEVVWTEEEAEREVDRLNTLNADEACSYHWQATRVKRPAS